MTPWDEAMYRVSRVWIDETVLIIRCVDAAGLYSKRSVANSIVGMQGMNRCPCIVHPRLAATSIVRKGPRRWFARHNPMPCTSSALLLVPLQLTGRASLETTMTKHSKVGSLSIQIPQSFPTAVGFLANVPRSPCCREIPQNRTAAVSEGGSWRQDAVHRPSFRDGAAVTGKQCSIQQASVQPYSRSPHPNMLVFNLIPSLSPYSPTPSGKGHSLEARSSV